MGGDVKLLTTQCVVLETEALGWFCFKIVVIYNWKLKSFILNLGAAVRQAMHIVKNFGIHKCGHDKNPISGANCLISMTKDNVNTRWISYCVLNSYTYY